MTPLARHIVHQRRMIASLSGVMARGLLQQLERKQRVLEGLPGPELCAEIKPPSAALIRDYVRTVGGDSSAYARTLPPHLFPHWSLPLAAQTLRKLPYPLLRVVNGGCRLEINAPLRAGEALMVRARLESVDDDGRRAVIRQRIVTGQRSNPEALVALVYAIVPTGRGERGSPRKPKEAQQVPLGAREIARLDLERNSGLRFALLTGDFNPVHWLAPYARAFGYEAPILHGFASLAYTFESLVKALLGGSPARVSMLDVRFVRPLVLPASVGVSVNGDQIYLGSPGQPAMLTGSYSACPAQGAEASSGSGPSRGSMSSATAHQEARS